MRICTPILCMTVYRWSFKGARAHGRPEQRLPVAKLCETGHRNAAVPAALPEQMMLIEIFHQFLRYAAVGAAATVAHYATLIGLVESQATGKVPGALAGFVVGGIVSYILNRRFTFDSDTSHGAAIPRFMLVTLVAFGLTGALMWVFAERLGIHYLLSQLVTTGIVLVWTFIGNRFWTFAASRP